MSQTTPSPTPPVALTIAGSDSGGNAGLAADLKSFAAHGVHGVFALTIATAQNTTGISGIHQLPSEFLGAQIDAVAKDFRIAATKTGLLYSPDAIDVVADRVRSGSSGLGPLVVDPVIVNSAGSPMLSADMTSLYVEKLFPHAAVITPNVAEASLLSGIDIGDRMTASEAALALNKMGPTAVVVTGLLEDGAGHDVAVDVVAIDGVAEIVEHARVDTVNVLGTGCSLSAAVTASLATGLTVDAAIHSAIAFVLAGLESAQTWRLGEGSGSINHFAHRPATNEPGTGT